MMDILREAFSIITLPALLAFWGSMSARFTKVETALFGEKNEPTLNERVRKLEAVYYVTKDKARQP